MSDMTYSNLLKALTGSYSRPLPFSRYTARELWTDPHISAQMLACHLDDSHGLASRPRAQIDRIVAWIDDALELKGKHLLDLGCGPGLYAARFVALGADVTGVDFSALSISHARAAVPDARFLRGDYLAADLPEADLVTLIYGDICALSPDLRRRLFARILNLLPSGGAFVLDAFSLPQADGLEEAMYCAPDMMKGFFAPSPSFVFKHSWLWRDWLAEHVLSLDHYLVLATDGVREIYNWLDYMTPDALSRELQAAGFTVERPRNAETGALYEDEAAPFAVIARKP